MDDRPKLPDGLPTPDWCNEEFGIALYNRDCLELLPQIPDGCIDAVVTDPPYGIANKWKRQQIGKNGSSRLWDGNNCWDKSIEPERVFASIRASRKSIIWGGNYYGLPASRGYLIWDKMQKFSNADSEYAWCSWPQTPRTFRYARCQLANEGKVHPTQKPLPLIEWCISFLDNTFCILDTFMGSGTTSVACINTNRAFIGCEISADYFQIAVKRIEDAIEKAKGGALFAKAGQ